MGNLRKNLAIVSGSEADAEKLTNAFCYLEDFSVLPALRMGEQVIALLNNRSVDAVLFDLFLSDMDGFAVLDRIEKLGLEKPPAMFAMTALTDDRLLSLLNNRVLYCFSKPLNYEIVSLRVSELLRAQEHLPMTQPTTLELMDRKISECIRAVGVPVHLKGYYYLRDAIRMYALFKNPVELCITTDIYPAVAKLYNTRATLVEHAMRNAIEIAWTRGNLNVIFDYFGYTVNDHKGKPSNLEFVAMIAERVRMQFRCARER